MPETRPRARPRVSQTSVPFDFTFLVVYAWHGTLNYFVGRVTCHCLCASRYIRITGGLSTPELFADRNGGGLGVGAAP